LEVWLAVETATATGSVAVWKGGLAFEQTLRIHGTHSERVLPAVDYALSVTRTVPDEVSAFVVGSGPGSFTGVRIAASLAKGWSMARGTPLFAYSSLLAAAAGSGAQGPVCALFDARRGQVYAACYRLSGAGAPGVQLEPSAWTVDELLEELSSRGLVPVFVGEGAIAYRELICRALTGATVLPEHVGVPRAASLLWLRSVAPDLGRVARPEVWEPLYVRDWRVLEEGGRR
jgi:tRNA threonylcarbamoyladenosine biosynthesis protein TsaB